MSVVNFKSGLVTNLDASPVVYHDAKTAGGTLRSAFATGEFAASDDTSVGRMIRVRSSDVIRRVELATDDLGTGGTVDVGLHQTSANGGAVVDADFFASAVNTDSAAVARTDVTYESATAPAIENRGKALWAQLALSADPNLEYDITVTRNTAAGTGTVSLWVEYVNND